MCCAWLFSVDMVSRAELPTSNTRHDCFDKVTTKLSLPYISIHALMASAKLKVILVVLQHAGASIQQSISHMHACAVGEKERGISQAHGVLQVCTEEHQRYLLFSSLLRHTGSSSTSTSRSVDSTQQAALVELAAAEGRALEGGLASPALVLAVKVSSLLSCSLATLICWLTFSNFMMECVGNLERCNSISCWPYAGRTVETWQPIRCQLLHTF